MPAKPLINICGEQLVPDARGALFWQREETLIVSDLHFEKGSSFAARRSFLPPYDTRATLSRIAALIRQYHPRRVVSLGDAFHDRDAEARMDREDVEQLKTMTKMADWLWILGNHDPQPPAEFSGAVETAAEIGPLIFRHEPSKGPVGGEVSGHLHPCARVASEGRIFRRRCFAVGDHRMIMPALGAYTGGLNVLDDAYDDLWDVVTAWVMGAHSVHPVGSDRLEPDVARRRAG